jgi:Ni2+-binding GTPase involved in maturation of urease and hydrogenase
MLLQWRVQGGSPLIATLVYNLGDGLWVFMVDIVYRIHVVSKTTPHIFLQGGP